MTSLVVDASIIGGVYLSDEWTDRVPAIFRRIEEADVVAPAHWPVETANLLTMAMRRGRIDRADRDRLAVAASALPVAVEESMTAARQSAILAIADACALTVYDAAYLELAERVGGAIATNDRALAKAATARGVSIFSTSL